MKGDACDVHDLHVTCKGPYDIQLIMDWNPDILEQTYVNRDN